MTTDEVILTKVGAKGQIVIGQKLRERYHLHAGMVVRQLSSPKGILIQSLDKKKLLDGIDALAQSIGKKWPKGLDSVEAIRQDRR